MFNKIKDIIHKELTLTYFDPTCKTTLYKEITLTYFDPTCETTLRVDASSKGLGAVLTIERQTHSVFIQIINWHRTTMCQH